MLGLLRSVVTVGSLGVAGTVLALNHFDNPFDTSPTERIEAQIKEARAQVELVEAQKELRAVQAEVDSQRIASEELVARARRDYPDLVAFIEARSEDNVFAVAELVKVLVPLK